VWEVGWDGERNASAVGVARREEERTIASRMDRVTDLPVREFAASILYILID